MGGGSIWLVPAQPSHVADFQPSICGSRMSLKDKVSSWLLSPLCLFVRSLEDENYCSSYISNCHGLQAGPRKGYIELTVHRDYLLTVY